ncbi:hypothetical protein A9Q75_15465 [Colwellia psychrerythraea]|uniref:Uncharacterized protein n=1 Tax=Colwellia psychrerythraea TaxID=28229 RepID=A0A1Y5E2W7_COLPS|nr:hypothetical protein A9Q75_15465 [Colwellia psychrerythraea]
MMNLIVPDIISSDNKRQLRFPGFAYDIEIIDLTNQQVLHQRTDYGGDNTSGTFTENEDVVIYLTVCKHGYIPPIIKIWDLKNDTFDEIVTPHSTQHLYLPVAYHKVMRRLVIADFIGGISTYNVQTREIMWYKESPEDSNVHHIIFLAFSECGDKVAALQKDKLTVYDFTTGKIRLSTPLMDEYSTCEFQEEDLYIHVNHPEKETIRVCCKDIIF